VLIVNFIFFSHAINDCNTFRRHIQSAINEGRLKFHEMQVDENPFANSVGVLDRQPTKGST
jgi:hypothetical protein